MSYNNGAMAMSTDEHTLTSLTPLTWRHILFKDAAVMSNFSAVFKKKSIRFVFIRFQLSVRCDGVSKEAVWHWVQDARERLSVCLSV